MAIQRLGADFDLQMKTRYDTAQCKFTVQIEGREVPNLELIGQAFEAARITFEEKIKEGFAPKPTTAPAPVPEPTTAIA